MRGLSSRALDCIVVRPTARAESAAPMNGNLMTAPLAPFEQVLCHARASANCAAFPCGKRQTTARLAPNLLRSRTLHEGQENAMDSRISLHCAAVICLTALV